jgi:hypothetical protein
MLNIRLRIFVFINNELCIRTEPTIDSSMEELEPLAPPLWAKARQGRREPITLSPHAGAYKEALLTTRVFVDHSRL